MSSKHNDRRWHQQHDKDARLARARLEIQSQRIRHNLNQYKQDKRLREPGLWSRLVNWLVR